MASVSTRILPAFAGRLLLLGLVFTGLSLQGRTVAAAWAEVTDRPPGMVQLPDVAHLVDLRVEMEPAMFRGTVEAVDLHNFSVTIRTDFGHLLSLTDTDCGMISGLRQGDRVSLELDAQQQVTLKRLEQAADDVTPALPQESSDRSAERCVRGAF